MSINRRDFMKMTGCCAGAAAVATTAVPGVSFAGPINAKKIVVIGVDGGLDGWGMITPVYGDPDYARFRGALAVPGPNDMNAPAERRALYMSDLFGMHPRMPELYGMFQRGEATLHMNVALQVYGYNTGSHFVEQRLYQNGLNSRDDSNLSGWLNRLLTVMEGERNPGAIAVTGSPNLPANLRGREPSAIYMPPGITTEQVTIDRLRRTMGTAAIRQIFDTGYERRQALNQALNGANINLTNFSNFWGFTTQAQVVGTILGSDPATAPSVAYMSFGGVDFHTMENNGWGYPAARVAHLSAGLGVLVDTLKRYNVFQDTLIIVVSEFGRPVEQNGGGGTDHGHGQTGIIITGNPSLRSLPGQGIAMNGPWPGLASRNPWNSIRENANYMNIIRDYVRAHFNMSVAEIDAVIPTVTRGNG